MFFGKDLDAYGSAYRTAIEITTEENRTNSSLEID
jgi:hypothetical protein